MTGLLRRSQVADRLAGEGAVLVERAGGLVATRVAATADEESAVARLALADASALPRFGLKGQGTIDWATAQGVIVPERPNLAAVQPQGGLVLRLAPQELFVVSDLTGTDATPDRLERVWPLGEGRRGWPMLRAHSHSWFVLTGELAPDTLAAICAVDLRPHKFPALAVAQTQAVGLSVIVVRTTNERPTYHLFLDSAAALYAWDAILDAMAEHHGAAVGLDALV